MQKLLLHTRSHRNIILRKTNIRLSSDAITNVYLYSKLADNVTATVTARYTAANSGSAKNITLRSGATSSAAYLTKKDMNGNTLYVDVKKETRQQFMNLMLFVNPL